MDLIRKTLEAIEPTTLVDLRLFSGRALMNNGTLTSTRGIFEVTKRFGPPLGAVDEDGEEIRSISHTVQFYAVSVTSVNVGQQDCVLIHLKDEG